MSSIWLELCIYALFSKLVSNDLPSVILSYIFSFYPLRAFSWYSKIPALSFHKFCSSGHLEHCRGFQGWDSHLIQALMNTHQHWWCSWNRTDLKIILTQLNCILFVCTARPIFQLTHTFQLTLCKPPPLLFPLINMQLCKLLQCSILHPGKNKQC